jgi:dolichyl-diphosphooligosaccharide--protein glycosyltransferase
MNFPDGAAIPWPPLFDHLAASAAMVIGGGDPSRDLVERVAACVPVVFGVLTVPLVAALAWLLLGRRYVVATAFLVSVLPAHVLFSSVGRFDQHVAEVFFLAWVALAFASSWRPGFSTAGSLLADGLLGMGICLAFWTWQGSALHLLFITAFTGLWHALAPAGCESTVRVARSLARGGAFGGGLMLASLAAFAPLGTIANMDLLAVSGFHVAVTGVVACFGAFLWFLHRLKLTSTALQRLLGVAVAAVVPATAAVTLIPGFWGAIRHGLIALGRGNDWYRNIQEFDPLLFAGFKPVWVEVADTMSLFGLGLVLLPVAIVWVIRGRREFGPDSVNIFFLVVCTVFFLVLALARQRFVIYLSVPLALCIALLWRKVASAIAERLTRRSPGVLVTAVVGLVIIIPSLGWYAEEAAAESDPTEQDLVETLQWLRGRDAPDPSHPAVLAEWSYGHHIEYLADRPVVANPFGTDIGPDAMADSAQFFLAQDPSDAERIVTKRHVDYVMLTNPVVEAYFALAFAPAGTAPVVNVKRALLSEMRVDVTDRFWGLVASRLYFFDGMVPTGYAGEALGGYRLVYESPSDESWQGRSAKTFKIFGCVPGVRLSVLTSPGSRVTARTTLTTNQGRVANWASTVVADAPGSASIRLPYATGLNGVVDASAYELVSEDRRAMVEVSESDVESGGEFLVVLGGN